ncbi:MAG: hypothetical protein IJ111_01920 [Eggerthellaceae bacterium]|nr:hypothetical protein [Eggerthellaceae bacterium]
MMETLIVVGILVVVAALVAPNVIDTQKSLRMTELDAKAEQIYNAAQYQLSALKAAGRLGVFESDDATAEVLPLPVVPSDYPSEDGGGETATVSTLRFTTSAGNTAKTYILSPDTASVTNGVTNGDYVVEFSPNTGEVFAVFYWENDAVAADGAQPATPEAYYRKICGYRSSAAGVTFRTDHRIGYYNGGEVSLAVESSGGSVTPDVTPFNLSDLSLDLLNEEELYIKIYNPGGSLANTDFDPSKLKLSIFIQELDVNPGSNYENPYKRALINVNGGVQRNDIPDVNGNVIQGGSLSFNAGVDSEIDYILDSLYKDASGQAMSFARLTDNKIRPGANVAITVYAQYEGQHWKKGPKTVNSTFGDYYFEDDGNGNKTGVIDVSSIRHLENITTTPVDQGGDSIKYLTIRLTSDITYDGTQWAIESVATNAHRSRENRNPYYEDGAYSAMEPIELPDYFLAGNNRVIDGQGHKLEGLIIGDPNNPQDRAGLFSYLKCCARNLELVNPIVYGRNDVGALAGYVDRAGLSFENIKISGGSVNGEKRVGGLVGGSKNSTYIACTSSADVTAGSGGFAGGLIGATEGTGVNVDGEQGRVLISCSVGFTAFTGDKTTISSSGSYVGGLVGGVDFPTEDGQQWSASGGFIRDCTVYADVTGLDYVGGFVGATAEGGWLIRFSGCSVLPSYDANLNPILYEVRGRNYVGGFGGRISSIVDHMNNTAQINVTSTGNYAGGYAGELHNTTAKKCTASRVDDEHVPVVSCSGANVDAFAVKGSGSGTENCSSDVTVRR